MSWSLQVYLSGMFVIIPTSPDGSSHEAVFVSSGTGSDKHSCQIGMFGEVRAATTTLPFSADVHDLYIHDGKREIGLNRRGAQRLMESLPQLQYTVSGGLKPKANVLRPGIPTASNLWSARLGLYGGTVTGKDFTQHDWEVYCKAGSAVVDGPKKLAQSLLYELSITSAYARIEARGRSACESWEIRPLSGSNVAEVHIRNSSGTTHQPVGGIKNESPHFRLAFDLFTTTPKCILRESNDHPYLMVRGRRTKRPQGVHLPCVGGCTC